MTDQDHAAPLRQGEHALYLLRVWHEYDGDRPVWRASVKPPHGEQRHGFTSPGALLRYLAECLGPVGPPG
ncbi:hypothetical protein DAERI_080076 [Deinococcus aerius]|uniref:Uncharacterized protein n=1 Tax=Deinococcus aerius TaxID=200253 RepID=A0A2I9DZ84_9DEIO|nr:hypothetical protein [Deinococcus aerius]GBF06285.1 hypothetical protein DAERI_080076 [Deinococcus aerius]